MWTQLNAYFLLSSQGELTITTDMEALEYSIFMDTVPPSWEKRAYPSMLGLGGWFADLMLRLKELENWVGDFQVRGRESERKAEKGRKKEVNEALSA